MRSKLFQRGFTLIEVMITVAIVAILASIALPSYTAYLQRSRVPPALDALSSLHTRMEQRFQDTGAYTCPANSTAGSFNVVCVVTAGGQGFTATATGAGNMAGYEYTINQAGTRATTAHPKGANAACWTIRGTTCGDA